MSTAALRQKAVAAAAASTAARSRRPLRIAFEKVKQPYPQSRGPSVHSQLARPGKSLQMIDKVEIQWLGTAAGSPSKTRNVSCAALRMDGETWIIDVGEATQHQMQKANFRPTSISKIFLTHMHGDHTFGLVPFLCSLADGAGGVLDKADPRTVEAAHSPPIDIYGLTGTRRLVRTLLECTYTNLARQYRVHELLFNKDEVFSGRLHRNELPGDNFYINDEGYWPDFVEEGAPMKVSAVPIKHTVPCVGFIFQEPPRPESINVKECEPIIKANWDALTKPPYNLKHPMNALTKIKLDNKPLVMPDGSILNPPARTQGRKLVFLGDTFNGESDAMDKVAKGADLVVHEATNAYLPGLDYATKDDESYESVRLKAKSHGHSTPQVAGKFAKRIGARNLLLNHFSNRYIDYGSTLAPKDGQRAININDQLEIEQAGPEASDRTTPAKRPDRVAENAVAMLREIERQAEGAWGAGRRVVATRDFMRVCVKPSKVLAEA